MNEKTIKALVDAGAVKKVLIIAEGSAIHVDIVTQNDVVTATLKGTIKLWVTLDTSAKWVRNLGIGRVQLVMDKWLPAQRSLNL